MSEPIEMSLARNIYSRECERFRRELVFILRQYDSCPMSFEIKQHIRLRAMDLKPECVRRYQQDTAKIANNQPPVVGNSLRIRSMCTTELPNIRWKYCSNVTNKEEEDGKYSLTSNLSNLPLNKMTYESSRRATTNSHVLSFERQLIDDINRMIDSIDHLREQNRQEWLQPSKNDRQRQYFNSLYDDVGYSLPMFNSSNLIYNCNNDNYWMWKYAHDKDDDQKTEVERFYNQYLSSSSYLNCNKLKDNYKPKTGIISNDFDVATSTSKTTTRTSRRYLYSMDE